MDSVKAKLFILLNPMLELFQYRLSTNAPPNELRRANKRKMKNISLFDFYRQHQFNINQPVLTAGHPYSHIIKQKPNVSQKRE